MDQGVVENPIGEEQTGLKLRPINIFDKKYRFHYTRTEKLLRLLKRGIYSRAFAARIKDRQYRTTSQKVDRKNVWITPEMEYYIGKTDREGKFVGIIVDTPEVMKVPYRIAPRQFVGLLQPDVLNDPEETASRVNRLVQFLGVDFERINIYGRDGGLYWPRRMTHEQIVEELRRKNEV